MADEPTPGLDLELAVRALDDLRAFADEGGGVLLITHDIELALRVADRIAVFKDGTVVEETAVESFSDPRLLRHPFTRALWHALPEHDFDPAGGDGAAFERTAGVRETESFERAGEPRPALEARDVTFGYDAGRPLYEGFSLAVHPGERVALRAPSGFGKTTLCRLLAGYEVPQKGSVLVDGSPLARTGACPVQLIGQQPDAVVDPLLRMERTLAEAGSVDERLCEALGIKHDWMRRYPHELSGGELQRFCIARALMARPALPGGGRDLHDARRRDPGTAVGILAGRGGASRAGAGIRLPRPGSDRAHRHARGGACLEPAEKTAAFERSARAKAR